MQVLQNSNSHSGFKPGGKSCFKTFGPIGQIFVSPIATKILKIYEVLRRGIKAGLFT